MSTNQAFINAYRRDAAEPAAPPPAYDRRVTVAAACQTSVEIAAAGFVPTAAASAAARAPAIGKRPLSSFLGTQSVAPPPADSEFRPDFTPETILSSFRWPRVCRTLWEQHGDEYDRVAQQLLAVCRDGRPLVGIAGLHRGDGCSTTLLLLAVALATRRTRLILVDADFPSPSLAGLLGVEPTTTWQDVLSGGVPVDEAVIRAAQDHVDLLPLDARAADRHEAKHRAAAAGLPTAVTASVLRRAYDVVLLDLGALLAPRSFPAIDQLLRNMRIDAAVAVSDPHTAQTDDLALAAELLDDSGCELLGVIENRAAKPPATHRA